MDFECGQLMYDECSTIDQWQQRLLRYYESTRMRSRSPTGQLADLSDVMKANLSTAMVYKHGTWQVHCEIGPLSATVRGTDELECVLRCQKQLVNSVREFCGKNDGGDCAGTRLDRSRKQSLVDDETKRTDDGRSVFGADVEVSAKVSPLRETPSCNRDAKSSGTEAAVEEADDHNSVTRTTHRDDENAPSEEKKERSAGSDESEITTCDPAATASDEPTTTAERSSAEKPKKTIVELWADVPETIMESSGNADALQQATNRLSIVRVFAGTVMDALTRDNVQSIADALLRSLGTDKSNVGVVVDSIIREACRESDRDCALYAEMCCAMYEKALADARPAVRNCVSYLFKSRLIDTLCASVSGKEKHEGERRPDGEGHRRRLAASRFLGELFAKQRLYVYFAVSRTVFNLLESCGPDNVESLECLCMLLMTVGPKFKKVGRWNTFISMKTIYDELERCVKVGCSEKDAVVLPERTVSMINRLLDSKKRKRAN